MTKHTTYDPIQLEIFRNLFSAIAEEMGVILRKASLSPNIKERRDFSCAVFDRQANMVAQAAHIPVHLGSMPLSVSAAIQSFPCDKDEINSNAPLEPGDHIILNDPYKGGTHLPDITLVTPVFTQEAGKHDLIGFVASRAHHADVGGMAAGSMSITREIFQEGIIIPPVKIYQSGIVDQGVIDLILANVRTPHERKGDLLAQIAANERGANRLRDLVKRYGRPKVVQYMGELLSYTERMTRELIRTLPKGEFSFTDYLDNDGVVDNPIRIHANITINEETVIVDFSGSSEQVAGSLNAVYAITLSAVFYVFRSLIGMDIPNNSGSLSPISVIAPEGTIVNARFPAPVAGGNVETSQRIVDVLIGALSKACPEKIPAASQGTMNNLTIGGWDDERKAQFTYYETIGGGSGANKEADGLSAVQTHMTNTLNTPIEALEYAYPLRVIRYEIRQNSGGDGMHRGGNGIRKDIQVLTDTQVSLISERRSINPYGLFGGEPGSPGENILFKDEEEIVLPSKGTFTLKMGDILSIRTPGGGGYGKSHAEISSD